MPTTIELQAVRLSSYAVTFTFEAAPNNDLSWTLVDLAGNVINDRRGVSIGTATTVRILLNGPDLDFFGDDEKAAASVNRRLILKGTYDSDLGAGLSLVEFAEFTIVNARGVAS